MDMSAGIASKHLFSQIGRPDCPILIDVCLDEDFCIDPKLIPGAKRFHHSRILELVSRLQGQSVVIICQKGLKLSQGAAALLRACGIEATFLTGGVLGWEASGLPRIPADQLNTTVFDQHNHYVTSSVLIADTTACHWMIRRFVDPTAKFLLVEPDQVELVAQRFDARSICPTTSSGANADGSTCFATLVSSFGLNLVTLNRLTEIVDGLIAKEQSSPAEVPGVCAVSTGLSLLCDDPHKHLDATLVLYDALYQWAAQTLSQTQDRQW